MARVEPLVFVVGAVARDDPVSGEMCGCSYMAENLSVCSRGLSPVIPPTHFVMRLSICGASVRLSFYSRRDRVPEEANRLPHGLR